MVQAKPTAWDTLMPLSSYLMFVTWIIGVTSTTDQGLVGWMFVAWIIMDSPNYHYD